MWKNTKNAKSRKLERKSRNQKLEKSKSGPAWEKSKNAKNTKRIAFLLFDFLSFITFLVFLLFYCCTCFTFTFLTFLIVLCFCKKNERQKARNIWLFDFSRVSRFSTFWLFSTKRSTRTRRYQTSPLTALVNLLALNSDSIWNRSNPFKTNSAILWGSNPHKFQLCWY